MHVSVISTERAVFDGEGDAVVAPAYDGMVGILPRHAPFLTLLGTGIVTIRRAGGSEGGVGASRIQVSGGFLQVADDVVRIVARSASPTDY